MINKRLTELNKQKLIDKHEHMRTQTEGLKRAQHILNE